MCVNLTGGGFSKEDLEGASTFLGLSCVQGTWDQYNKPWKMWEAYLLTVKGPGFGNPRLEEMTRHDQVIRMVLFIKHLYETGLRKDRVIAYVAAISANMQRLTCDTSLFGDALITRAKNGTVGTNEELAAANAKKLAKPTLPMALEMVMKARERFWEGKAWDALGMNWKAAWLCIALGFNFGARIGHLTLNKGKSSRAPKPGATPAVPKRASPDHCLKCEQMKFYVRHPGLPNLHIMLGGEEIRTFLQDDVKGKTCRVEFLEVSFLTSKTSRKVTRNVVHVKKIARSTLEEITLLQDICEWMVYAKPKAADEITCRYASRDNARGTVDRKVITASEVNKAIKALAEYLNLPPAMFSSRSLRSGLATHLTAQGVSNEKRNQIGGWTVNSQVVDRHYAHTAAIGGALGADLEGPGVWSLGDVRHMVRQRQGR